MGMDLSLNGMLHARVILRGGPRRFVVRPSTISGRGRKKVATKMITKIGVNAGKKRMQRIETRKRKRESRRSVELTEEESLGRANEDEGLGRNPKGELF
ncbi:hypothetical protein GOBAR_DD04732 [Gossypium barbadense]|nr:hypothetical protein GOBAR_DD04732 [Gossypium barbadense]